MVVKTAPAATVAANAATAAAADVVTAKATLAQAAAAADTFWAKQSAWLAANPKTSWLFAVGVFMLGWIVGRLV